MKTTIKLASLLLLLVLAVSNARAQSYWAVDDSASGGANDGTSWNDAFLQLQEALQIAQPGDWILVAEGTYRPDWNPITNTVTGNQSDTFQMKNGVAIFGGFPNGGNGARDPKAHVTILSGEINNIGFGDNSYHVVTAGPSIDGSALLDGVSIRYGRAKDAYPNDRGAGMLILGSPTLNRLEIRENNSVYGAGIYNEADPTLDDVTITLNSTSGGGGGMWNEWGAPQLHGVIFLGNSSLGEGGGLFTEGGGPHIWNSRFLQNWGVRGGGISQRPGGSLTLENVEIARNQATSDIAGGILNQQSELLLNNVTLSANTAPVDGGGLYPLPGSIVTVSNSIVWGNSPNDLGGEMIATVFDAAHSLIPGVSGPAVLDADPLFRDNVSDFRLQKGSPAIGLGDPATCAATERRGWLRDDACDAGAYEYLGTPGTYWSNGEVDFVRASPSYWALDGSGSKLTVDDFTVPDGMTCIVTGVRGVMQDGSLEPDAFALLYPDSDGVPWIGGGENFGYAATWCADGSASCTQDSDCPGSTCIIPGKHLGNRDGEFVWEPHLNVYPPRGLTPGRYWVGLQGYLEPGSAGFVYALSGGDGAVQGSAYEFCDYWSPCVYGSPAAGDVPRDLALDIDAVCQLDADGDFSGTGVDCDDSNPNRFPGNPEVCDGIDNDCDNLADTGSAPSASPTLQMTRTQLSWNAVPNAAGYDIVRGSLDTLRASGGDFTNSACEDNDVAGTTYDIGDGIPHGLGVWYVIRTSSPCGNTSYDDGSASQLGSRDPEIASSGSACP